MDDRVLRGMAKWPGVPAAFGWLRLDRRGQWRIRGHRISNPALVDFIARNYARDDSGQWFFQNGPQRVFVSLDYTPFVYRVMNHTGTHLALEAHTGAAVTAVTGIWIDDKGTILVNTEHGVGLIHDLDLQLLLPHFAGATIDPLSDEELERRMELIATGRNIALTLQWRDVSLNVASITTHEVPLQFKFVQHPSPPAADSRDKALPQA